MRQSETLKNQLIQYKTLTIRLIELLERNEFESLESVFQLRQDVIEVINKLHFNNSEFKMICDEISLLQFQKKLTLLMYDKKAKIKIEINNLKNTKIANIEYNRGNSIDSLYFNKRI